MHMKLATVIKSGNYLEAKTYDPPIHIQRGSSRRTSIISAPYTSENHEQHKQQAINRAKRKLRRLIECNFNEHYSFITLTFTEDIRDIKLATKRFEAFKKRITRELAKRCLPKLKYIYVIEFQGNREGGIHFHLLTNLTKCIINSLNSYWIHGYTKTKFVTATLKDNERIWRYLTKGFGDELLIRKRHYVASKGLKKPTVADYEDREELDKALIQSRAKLHYSTEYNYGVGFIKYEEYYTE